MLAELIVLAAVGLVGDDDDVRAFRQHRHRFPVGGGELLDQREHVPLIAAQQLLQMHPAACLRLVDVLGQRPG
jgi:hypothetical protein